jgi:PAS domain S-box-containing protein
MQPSVGAASASPGTELRRERPTLGVLYGWQIYVGETDLYLEELVKSLTAAARRKEVNLLTAVAVGARARVACPAWPSLGPGRVFAPVGPWNTDGLIVINPLPAPETVAEVRRFQTDGHPLVYLTSGPFEPTIVPDNEGGIALAVEHLVEHGHRRIAFISCEHGDGSARKRAYEETLRRLGLDVDPALVADGSHERLAAMRAVDGLFDGGAEFTALVASNGNSGRGALERLRERGLEVPGDVAVVAFDDFLEALATEPALTSVHFPVEAAAEAAVDVLLDWVEHGRVPPPSVSVATHLVERESCGCRPSYGGEAERDRRTLAGRLVVRSEVVRAVSAFSNRLLAARRLDMTALGRILAETLADPSVPEPLLGIYGHEDDDPVAWTVVQPSDGEHVVRFATRAFPPPELGLQEPFQLIVTPLRLHEEFGFLALASDDVASCTEIAHHAQTAFESARNSAGAEHGRFLLRALLDNTTDQIYFKDRESRFISISTALALKLGLAAPDEAISKTDFDFFSEEHAQQAFADEQRIMQSGEPLVGIEEKETWENGREAWVLTSKMPLRDERDAIIGTLGVSRDVTVETAQRQEIEHQADLLRRALADTEKARQNLQTALDELHLAQEERLRLLARTVEASEQERRRIAADLHDGPVQQLTATALAIDLLVNHLARGERDVEGLAQKVRDELAEEIASLRRMFSELLPPILDERGVAAAISADAAELLPPETSYTINDRTGVIRFAHDVETVTHRIAREALVNVQKHARPTHVEVDLDHVGDTLRLTIADDGVGFDPEALNPNTNHFGLQSMRERAESLSGQLHIGSSPGTGVRLQATLPWRPRPAGPPKSA